MKHLLYIAALLLTVSCTKEILVEIPVQNPINTQLQSQITQLQNTISNLTSTNTNLESQISLLQSEASLLESEIASQSITINEAEDRIAEIEDLLDDYMFNEEYISDAGGLFTGDTYYSGGLNLHDTISFAGVNWVLVQQFINDNTISNHKLFVHQIGEYHIRMWVYYSNEGNLTQAGIEIWNDATDVITDGGRSAFVNAFNTPAEFELYLIDIAQQLINSL